MFLAKPSFRSTISFIGLISSFGRPCSANLAKSGLIKLIFFVTASFPLKNSYIVFNIFCFVRSVWSTYSGFFNTTSIWVSKPLNLPSASFKNASTRGLIKVDSFAISILWNSSKTSSIFFSMASILYLLAKLFLFWFIKKFCCCCKSVIRAASISESNFSIFFCRFFHSGVECALAIASFST